MIAYKHTPPQFLEGVLNGRFKISLLSHFRKLERPGSKIPDPLDGALLTSIGEMGLQKIDANEDDPEIRALMNLDFKITGNVENLRLGNIGRLTHVDAYILSLCSHHANESLRQDGNTAVIRIMHLLAFAEKMAKKHSDKLGRPKVARVRYARRSFNYRESTPLPDAFIKGPEFAVQNEVRIAWEARATEDSFISDCPEISPWLKIIKKG